MPLSQRLTRLALAHQAAMKRIQPELDALKRRYASNPQRLHEEVQTLFARERISAVPVASCLGTLAQAPVMIGAIGIYVQPSPSAENRNLMLLLSTAVTLVVLSKMSAGVALYWGMSNAFAVAQGLIGRRGTRQTG